MFPHSRRTGINVDMISQQMAADGSCTVSFSCDDKQGNTLEAELAKQDEFKDIVIDRVSDLAMISLVGVGMATHSGVSGKVFQILAENGIRYYHITTSEISISVTVAMDQKLKAAIALCELSTCKQSTGTAGKGKRKGKCIIFQNITAVATTSSSCRKRSWQSSWECPAVRRVRVLMQSSRPGSATESVGVGADGFIIVRTEPVLEMVFFNRDGSRAPMCGNGIRCFSPLLQGSQDPHGRCISGEDPGRRYGGGSEKHRSVPGADRHGMPDI